MAKHERLVAKYEVPLREGSTLKDEVATTIFEAVRAALDTEAPGAAWRLKVEIAGRD